MPGRKEVITAENTAQLSVAEYVMSRYELDWSEDTKLVFATGMSVIERVMSRVFQGEWNGLTLNNAKLRLRKNYYDEKEDPFGVLKKAISDKGASDESAALAVDTGVREIIRRRKAKKYTPISPCVPRKTLKLSSERFKFGSLER